jgi:hypothetical protein
MDYVKIGNRVWDVLVTEVSEDFNILYSENTGRTMSQGSMTLDPIGTFYGHKVTFARKNGKEAQFDALFDYVSKPRYDGVPVEIVHGQTTLKYNAYISNGSRSLKKINPNTNKVFWDALQLNIVPMEAQVLPE